MRVRQVPGPVPLEQPVDQDQTGTLQPFRAVPKVAKNATELQEPDAAAGERLDDPKVKRMWQVHCQATVWCRTSCLVEQWIATPGNVLLARPPAVEGYWACSEAEDEADVW